MKPKKLLRQQTAKAQKVTEHRRLWENDLKRVTLKPTADPTVYAWTCPKDRIVLSYSPEINARYGHPEHLVFCAICNTYFTFAKETVQA